MYLKIVRQNKWYLGVATFIISITYFNKQKISRSEFEAKKQALKNIISEIIPFTIFVYFIDSMCIILNMKFHKINNTIQLRTFMGSR